MVRPIQEVFSWANLGPTFNPTHSLQGILNNWARYAYGDPSRFLDQSQQLNFDANAVKSLLGGHGKILVVLDDVWELNHIKPLLEALPVETNVLLTTQSEIIARRYTPIFVDNLKKDQAIKLLSKGSLHLDTSLLSRVAEKLNYHAQSLNLAAQTIASSYNPQKATETLLERGLAGSQFLEFAQTFNFCFEALDEKAKNLLLLLGVFHPANAEFDSAIVAKIWELSIEETEQHLNNFRHRSLISLSYQESEDSSESTTGWQLPSLMGYKLAELLNESEHAELAKTRYIQFVLEAKEHWFVQRDHVRHMLYAGKDLLDNFEGKIHL